MSSAYLPISERWHHYVRQSDDLAQELEEETAREAIRFNRNKISLSFGSKTD